MSLKLQTGLLYTYRRCPYAMRARMALLQAGVPYQAHEVSLRDKPPAMLALSPKGTVPVLVLPHGEVLEQSVDIMRWAFEITGDLEGWWARAQTPVNQSLWARCDADFKHHLDRYKYPQRFSHALGAELHAHQAVAVLLEPLEVQLQAHDHLGGATPCAADIGIFPFVRQFAAVQPARFEALPLPALKSWLAQCVQSPLFEVAMRKLPSLPDEG
ncbi:MAG: glutathione S-transferase [Betaproteobacteria bacterium]